MNNFGVCVNFCTFIFAVRHRSGIARAIRSDSELVVVAIILVWSADHLLSRANFKITTAREQ